MKKNLLSLFYLLLCVSQINAQTVQATIKKGSQANSVIIAIKPSTTFSGKLSSLQFAIGIPQTLTTGVIAAISVNKNTYISYAPSIQTETQTSTAYTVFVFSGDGSQASGTEKTYTEGVDNDMVEVSFTGGASGAIAAARLMQVPNGGTGTNANFYIANAGTDITNLSAQFYGTGAVNDGNNYAGDSYVEVAGILLPVNWLSFTASLKGSGALLNWSAEEKNSKNFEITRSLDGTKFTTINQVASKGNGTNSYTYIDEAVTKVKTQGDIFYQLIQVDKDGKRSPSAIRTVRISLPEGGISVSPNPVLNIATVRFNHPKEEKATLLITDANGKVVYQQATQLQKGYNQKDINLSAISKGNYNLSVVSSSANKTIQLVKAGQ